MYTQVLLSLKILIGQSRVQNEVFLHSIENTLITPVF